LSERFVQAIRTDDVAPGGMKAMASNGREIVVCNTGGTFHAIARRCGHMNAPLERGTLDGAIGRTEPIAAYQTKVESDWVWVVVPT